ncbi:hypothetical protein VM1G_12007 [Cytospora mali]|uniref:Uncharacterized protein n=1 Tax=Cytospora mali TaxID=578113 RepID=A0A194VH38_CYTMA|nr:hypothetical protein VM1G_12007 [Valsa mali]
MALYGASEGVIRNKKTGTGFSKGPFQDQPSGDTIFTSISKAYVFRLAEPKAYCNAPASPPPPQAITSRERLLLKGA